MTRERVPGITLPWGPPAADRGGQYAHPSHQPSGPGCCSLAWLLAEEATPRSGRLTEPSEPPPSGTGKPTSSEGFPQRVRPGQLAKWIHRKLPQQMQRDAAQTADQAQCWCPGKRACVSLKTWCSVSTADKRCMRTGPGRAGETGYSPNVGTAPPCSYLVPASLRCGETLSAHQFKVYYSAASVYA